MTNEEIERVQQEAYDCVSKAANWIIKMAKQEKYTDEYIDVITQNKNPDKGVMPVAEIIMCLTNLMEKDYKTLGIPQPDSELLNKQIRNLLQRYENDGFSGFPYFRVINPNPDPPFTDAVCFTAAAINQALGNDKFDNSLSDKCETLLLECLEWLFDAAIYTSDKKENNIAWGWSSTKAIDKDPNLKKYFSGYLPPQTYFTANVVTTLLEILFDNHKLLEKKGLIGKILTAIVGGKNYLLTSLSEIGGWYDIKQMGKENWSPSMKPYQNLVDDYISLYPLETLSYIWYYKQIPKYGKIRSDISTANPELLESLWEFEVSTKNKLDLVFYKSIEITEIDDPQQLQAKIQVPTQFNKTSKADKNYYFDGTVIYNSLNSLNFYIDWSNIIKGEAYDQWENNHIKLVKTILEKAFDGEGFLHCGDGSSNNPVTRSIYATRTAIACLLSFGVKPPLIVQLEMSDEVKEFTEKLFHLMEKYVSDSSIGNLQYVDKVTNSAKFQINDLINLMKIAFSIGLLLKRLKESQSISFPNLYDPGSIPPGTIPVKVNSSILFSALSRIVKGSEEEIIEEATNMLKQRGLFLPISTVFQSVIEKKIAKQEILNEIIKELDNIIYTDKNLGPIKDLYAPNSN
jgi:hypothetical protein